MIRHQQKNMRPPQEMLLPVPDRFKQLVRHRRQSQLIVETFPAIDGDEIDFPVRIHPQRNVMRQMFAA
jgi:hypothetical protein